MIARGRCAREGARGAQREANSLIEALKPRLTRAIRMSGCKGVQQPNDQMITTDRLLIRPWRLEEADRFFDIHRRREVARWLSGIPMTDRQEAVERLERYKAELAVDSRFWSVGRG